MKTDKLEGEFHGERRRQFMHQLLSDLRALDRMILDGMIEVDKRRIGAEQEMFLIDRSCEPTPGALKMLEALGDPHFTTELGMFNLELNLDPYDFGGDCLSQLEHQIVDRLDQARRVAQKLGIDIVLTGILPTLRKSDLGLDNMVPKPRYQMLNRVMKEMRGGSPYEIHLKGTDELLLKHDSVMLEACNCSFQIHFQVAIDEFPNLYNIAQVVAAPVLACAVNSPLLFGKRLWMETRTALFQQSVDTRAANHSMRETPPRVTFGTRWVEKSVLELYREDVARFRTLVGVDASEDSIAKVKAGIVPDLSALRLHNGTVYRWNRACYGITGGKPHLRIENRVMPAGPSPVDSVANSAFWLGLIGGLAARYDDIRKVFEFEWAQANFTSAARQGLGGNLTWFGGVELSAQRLILDLLLPIADDGLRRGGISDGDRVRYLGVIEQRVRTGQTGSRWMLGSLSAMKDDGTMAERLHALTAAMVSRQRENRPVHEWEMAKIDEGSGWKSNWFEIEPFMTTDLVTVREDDSVDLVANLMEWQRVRHVLVEDDEHNYLGLVTYRSVLRLLTRADLDGKNPTAVADIMRRDAVTVTPSTPTLDVIRIMRDRRIACLPVVEDGRLVGVVTESDLMKVAGRLLEEKLGNSR